MKRGVRLLTVTILLCIFLFTSVYAEEQVIVNSRNWVDVYSGIVYAQLQKKSPNFLVSDQHSIILINSFPKTDTIEILSSKGAPYFFGYEQVAVSQGYDVEETFFDNMNLELLEELEVSDFIIVDDSYGYNAVSVAPYAALTGSYVIFADKNNIDDVMDILSDRAVDSVIIYGLVDREVLDAFESYDPEIINKGDRFENNVEIVKRYKAISDKRQIVLTNGEFIESEIMSGIEPVIFIGVGNVPDVTKEYISESNIEVGVLIGNELVRTATSIRRQLGITTVVKFARSARVPEGTISQVEGLDLFRLPLYRFNIGVQSIVYNRLSQTLEVTLINLEEQAVFLKGSYTVRSGETVQSVGDIDLVFLDGEDTKTIVYDIGSITNPEDALVDAFVIFGESGNSLEQAIDLTMNLSVVEISDASSIIIEEVIYDKSQHAFFVTILNDGEETVFVDTEVLNLDYYGGTINFGSDQVVEIGPGKKKKSIITLDDQITVDEVLENEKIRIRAYYGAREKALFKVIEGEFDLVVRTFNPIVLIPVVVVILILVLLFFSSRKKCRVCKKKNFKFKKRCGKCGAHLK